METILLDKYPWAASHDKAIHTLALFMGISFEAALQKFDRLILKKVAKEQLELPKAA